MAAARMFKAAHPTSYVYCTLYSSEAAQELLNAGKQKEKASKDKQEQCEQLMQSFKQTKQQTKGSIDIMHKKKSKSKKSSITSEKNDKPGKTRLTGGSAYPIECRLVEFWSPDQAKNTAEILGTARIRI